MSAELTFNIDDYGLRAIVVPSLRVDNVSVAGSAFVVGAPGPTAFLGFAHRLQLDLARAGGLADSLPILGASMIVHAFDLSPGHRRIPPEMRGEHGNMAGAMIDDPEGALTCSLVLYAKTDDKDDLAAAARHLNRNLQRYRLAGGRFVRSQAPSQLTRTGKEGAPAHPDAPILTAWSQEDLGRMLRVLPPGSALLNATSRLETAEADGRDALDRLLDLIAATEVTDGERTKWARSSQGWLVPLQVGWRALSEVADRPGMREGEGVIGHAWVEDVVGLGEWRATRRTFSTKGCCPAAVWRYLEAPPEGPYLVGTVSDIS